MPDEDAAAERLGGAFAGQNTGKTLPKTAAAIVAPKLARFHFQNALPQPPAFMPRSPHPLIFQSQPPAIAVRTRFLPGIPHRNLHFPCYFFNACNLVSRQTQYRL